MSCQGHAQWFITNKSTFENLLTLKPKGMQTAFFPNFLDDQLRSKKPNHYREMLGME